MSTNKNPNAEGEREKNAKIGLYATAVGIFLFGLTYASVPLYKVFCQVTGFGGTTQRAEESKARTVKPVDGARLISVYFDGTVPDTMPWRFTPAQLSVKVVPGETALAFYTAKNLSNRGITGVATYNVFPPQAGLYFNKIQCFCFEEQRLGAHEEIDMPVFFYIDPDIVDDPAMKNIGSITLSYTFFDTGFEEPEEDIEEEDEEEEDDKSDIEKLKAKVGRTSV